MRLQDLVARTPDGQPRWATIRAAPPPSVALGDDNSSRSPTSGPPAMLVILQAVQGGAFAAPFAPLSSSIDNHGATFQVFGDALQIQGVRASVSANLAQAIADTLDCSLLTAKLADLHLRPAHAHAAAAHPDPRQDDGDHPRHARAKRVD